ncbi:MAG: efflux RND transporter periplasmic adaptor subunit [Planctomycetales bacterium]|nr:efflux RND transporter periplasmic adaptor subunit [Planctomycetales bacterium]
MNSEKAQPKMRWNLAPVLKAIGNWGFAILGTAGVSLLLMIFAGVFAAKVPESTAHHERTIPEDAQIVEVALVRQPRFETAVGSIEPIHQSSVAAKLLAKVSEVAVSAGQQVAAGEVLVTLNDDELQSRLKQSEAAHTEAQAAAELAKSDFARASQLIQRNAISRAEFDAASTAVRTSEARLEQLGRTVEEARVVLDYATVTAPFDGVVVDKKVQAGDTVTPGQTLLTLYDPNQMQLVADVRESFAMQLKVGQQVRAKLETLDHQCLATVREVVPQADAGSRSFQVKVSGPCPPGIYSGMFGRIMLPLEDEELVVIPQAAVQRVGQLTLVDVVEGQSLIRRSVQLGRELGDRFEVLSGLRPGESIAIHSRGGSQQ